MTQDELAAVIQGVTESVREHIATVMDGYSARIAALESKAATVPRDGRDGKDADLSVLLALQASVSSTQAEWQAFKQWQAEKSFPAPLVTPEQVEGIVTKHLGERPQSPEVDQGAMVTRVKAAVLAEIPAPEKGEPGERGADGQDGKSIDPAVVDVMVAGAVESALKAMPAPQDGKDGVGITDLLIDADGQLVATLTDGKALRVGRVVGRDGATVVGEKGQDGKDGEHGLGWDDLIVEHDGERAFTFKSVRGDRVKDHGTFTVPVPIYRGLYKAGQTYDPGDAVTFGGSQWIAREKTSAKPEEDASESRAWTLAVKRGRNGERGLTGEKGQDGRPGRDGADMMPLGYQGRGGG